MRTALVTFAIGERYEKLFATHCKLGWESYTKRCGYELVILDKPIRALDGKSLAWQKLFLLDLPILQCYDRVVFVDSDIVIRENALPILNDLPSGRLGFVRAPECRGNEVSWYQSFSLSPAAIIAQTGVLCLEQKHRQILQLASHYPESGMYEMPALSREIAESGCGHPLDDRFNAVVGTLLLRDLPSWMVDHKIIKEFAWQLRYPPMIRALERICRENWFLHAAGAKRDLDRVTHTLARLQRRL